MCCYHLEDHQDCITSVNISPDTEMIAVSNENSTIYLYKLSENTTINEKKYQKISNRKIQNENKPNFQELVGGHSSTVFKAKFTHDSKYLLSCGDDNTACLWNVNKTKENLENKEKEEEEEEEEREEEDDLFNTKLKSSWSKNYNPAQTSLVTSYSGHLYSVWDLELYSQLNLFATASKDSTARLWSFDRIYPLRIFAGHQSDVNCVKFHPNGAYIATGSSDKTVRLWSVQSGDFVRLFSGHRSRVYSLAFSPDGTYLASAGEDKKIKVYDLRSGLVFKEFKGHSDIVHSLTFDNNSEILCSGGLDKTVKFWDLHQKNIKIGPELSDGCSGTSSGNSSNNTSSEFIQQNKNLSSPSTSNELIRSLNVDFNVYSIYCDMQNVFYVNGAKKMTNTSQSVNQNLNRNLNLDEKPIIICDKKPMEKSIDSSSTKKISAKNKTLPGETKKTLVSNQSVEATSDTTPKTSINTRSSRRNASDSQTNTPTTSAQANASSFLFSNDDDLYEI